MAKREHLIRRVCSVEGCNDSYYISYRTRTECKTAAREFREGPPYLCAAHKDPAAWIRPDNQFFSRSHQAEARPSSRMDDKTKLFWFFEHGGLVSGIANSMAVPQYYTEASDFPEGTLLRVTLTVEAILPEEQN